MVRSLAAAMAILPLLLWGSTYLVTTELLPADKPLTAAILRILPVGLLLTLLTRHVPAREHWLKLFVVSLLCMTLLHWALFLSAHRLPGGLAALSMSLGTLLIKRWQLPLPVLAFTGWQLTFGGLALLPAVLLFELPIGPLEAKNLGGYAYLAVLGTPVPYLLWFSALRSLDPVLISTLILLSPLSVMVLGYLVLDQLLTPLQLAGVASILIGIVVSNVPFRKPGIRGEH